MSNTTRTARRWLTWPKLLLYSVLLVLWAAWYVPRISADKYREPIHSALESALGRKVDVGKVQFQLLPVPGFTVENVVISEDPAVGPEPVAYISVMRGRPKLSALLGGPLEFASVDLEDTSVNLTRVDSAAAPGTVKWNFPELLRPRLLKAFPSVHLVSGRVNFKFGDTKSVFYLLNTDVDLWPPSSEGEPWTLKVRAEPARTDRPSRGFGFFVARGQWYASNSAVTLDVKMEKSELGDMITLFEGRESGIHGDIWGSAHLAGPISKVGIAGTMQIGDVHGWNQTPPGGSPATVAVSGILNVPAQSLDVRALAEGRNPVADLRYHTVDYLRLPKWSVTVLLNRLPLAPVVSLARNVGAGIPPGISVEGFVDGTVSYSTPGGKPKYDGQFRVSEAVAKAPDTPQIRIADFPVQFADAGFALGPVTLSDDAGKQAGLSARYDAASGEAEAAVTTEEMRLAALQPFLSAARVPVLGVANAGTWSGSVKYSTASIPRWSGQFAVKDIAVAFPALSQPLRISTGDVALDENGVTIKRLALSAGGVEMAGEYSFGINAQHRFHLTAATVDAAALEALFQPVLRRGGLLAKALNFGRPPEPDWLKDINLDGTLQAGSAALDGFALGRLKTRVIWEGASVRFEGVQFQLPERFSAQAAFRGDAVVDLSKPEADYSLTGKVSGTRWKGSSLEAEGKLLTSGSGTDLWARMKASGTLRMRNVDAAPASIDSLEGDFEWAWDGRNPRLSVPAVAATMGGTKWTGSALAETGGIVVLKLSDGKRTFEASGAVLKGEPLKSTGR